MDFKRISISALALFIILSVNVYGRQKDKSSLMTGDNSNCQFKWKQTILPTTLIGIGALAFAPGFIRNSSHEITHSVIDLRGSAGRLVFDDYIQYLPVASSLLPDSVGIKTRHTFRDRALIIATSYTTLTVLTNIPKFCIDEKRPEFAGHNAFPSGHTATAFMGAELVRTEYGGWYGFSAYAIATGVGFMRMYNGRHWFHDVIAGAGVGILSARIGEWSSLLWQKPFLKRKNFNRNLVLSPIVAPVEGGYYGVAMGYSF